jgi:hypothetical protein
MEAALRLAWCGPVKRRAAVLDATLTRQATLAAQGRGRGAAYMSESAAQCLHWIRFHRQALAG